LVVLITLLEMVPIVSSADANTVTISEVMANPINETSGEFIEIYNAGPEEIDLDGWQFTDGDSVDDIVAWEQATHGEITNCTTDTTLLPSETYAVILDNDYLDDELRYDFPNGTIIVTVANTTLGNGLTASSDPLTLYDNNAEIISTYGTPLDEVDPLDRDDDGLDAIPFDPGNGISTEKIDLTAGDNEENWAQNANGSGTPGATNNPLVNYPPEIVEALAEPAEINLDGVSTTNLKAQVTDQNGSTDIASVTADLSQLGGNAQQELSAENNDWYNYEFLPAEADPGNYNIAITAKDSQGEIAAGTISLTLIEPTYTDDVKISELLPNPSGTETEAEFIELVNDGNQNISLNGWTVSDGSRTYTLSGEIASDGYQAFYNADTKISLNNSGDSVILSAPNGDSKDEVSYSGTAAEDTSWARQNSGDFAWTTSPTPGATNLFTGNNEEVTEDSSDEQSSGSSQTTSSDNDEESLPQIDITAVRTKQKNDEVKTKGVVIAVPGMLSEKYFYIQDSGAGIQIYASDGEFPELKIGDEISVNGKVSEAQGEKRINAREGIIEVTGHPGAPEPQTKTTGEIQEEVEGMLVKTTGAITKQSGLTFYIDDSSGESKISIAKTTGIEKPTMSKGDAVTIVGVVGETKSGHRVLPRLQEDLLPGGEVAGASSSDSEKELPSAGPSTNLVWIIAAIGMAAFLAIRQIWKPRHLLAPAKK